MGAYASTNYAYFQKTNVIRLAKNVEQPVPSNQVTNTTSPTAPIIQFSKSSKLKYVDGLLTVHGPALNFKINDDIGLGVFANLRVAGGTHGITAAVNFDAIDKRPYREYFDFPASQFSTMVWSEIGLNYAQRFEIDNGFIGIGANFKYLQGYQAFYLNTIGTIKSSQFPKDTFSFIAPNVQFGFTNDILATQELQTKVNGRGFGLDLGVQYILPDEDADETDHKLILGATFLDLGRVRFKQNAETHFIEAAATYQPNAAEFKNIKTYQAAVALVSKNALGDSQKSLQSRAFNIGLPSAISLQADYKIYKYNYVGAIWTQRLTVSKSALTRANLLAIHYRFEHRWGAAMLPISLVNYKHLQLGFALRLAYLTLGSDNITSLFGQRNLYGSDFYFALKFNPFKLGLDFGQGSRGGRKISIFSRNKVKCPTF
jgi:hypothetical protein